MSAANETFREGAPIKMKKQSQLGDITKRFFKNKAAVVGLVIIILFVFCAVFPQVIATHDPVKQSLGDSFLPPSGEHYFGTDEFGRDIFSRVIYGCQTSLNIGLLSVAISCVIGTMIGCFSGYYGNRVDGVLMRLTDILMAIPIVMWGVSIVAAFGASTMNLIIAIAIGSIAPYARLVRVSVLSIKDMEYVEVAKSVGSSDARILTRHILPNCLAPIIVQASMSIAIAILTATGLSFLGLGVQPPTPEWGSMASSARTYMRDYWWMVTFPGLAITAAVFSFNLFGDGLRDALDPKLKS